MSASRRILIYAPVVSYNVTPRTEQISQAGRGGAVAWDVRGSVTSVAALAAGLLTLTVIYEFRTENPPANYETARVSGASKPYERSTLENSAFIARPVTRQSTASVQDAETFLALPIKNSLASLAEREDGGGIKKEQGMGPPLDSEHLTGQQLPSVSARLDGKIGGTEIDPHPKLETATLSFDSGTLNFGESEPLELTEELIAIDPIPVLKFGNEAHFGDEVMGARPRRDYSKTVNIMDKRTKRPSSGGWLNTPQSQTPGSDGSPSTKAATHLALRNIKIRKKIGNPKFSNDVTYPVSGEQKIHEVGNSDHVIGSSVRGIIDGNDIQSEGGQIKSIRLGAIVSLLESKMDKSEYLLLQNAPNSSQFVSTSALDAAGLGVRYDHDTGEVILFQAI